MARQKGTGSVYRQKRSPFFWISYWANGERHQEPTGTTDIIKACRILKARAPANVNVNTEGSSRSQGG
jgi:hypothetical protein